MQVSDNTIQVAVTMRRVPNTGAASRWESHRWELASVMLVGELVQAISTENLLVSGAFDVTLFKDDAQGYRLNVESPAPCWFVMWRMESGDESPDVQAVSLSYHDAGRWLDSQERVDQVPLLPAYPEILETIREFADLHDIPEVKRRKRPDSFKSLTDRFGKPAVVSTVKTFGAQQHGG
jgi:Protein of unknown function (DUF3305)